MEHALAMSSSQILMLAGADLVALSTGALWWPTERLLCVSDLHLGKSERLARRGGPLLPPYETLETLDRLRLMIDQLDPDQVVCLGDSFDDDAAKLSPAEMERLTSLMKGRSWIWIAGNHDPAPRDIGGSPLPELRRGPLTFRHEARSPVASGEISGHYHPKLRLMVRGRALVRPCFLLDERRLILPAFGAYAGGLWTDHAALRALLTAPVRAVLTGTPCLILPLAENGTCLAS